MSNYLCYVPFKLQMDSCVRCLRDGGADGAASVVLLLDEVEGCAGGDAVLEQVGIVSCTLFIKLLRRTPAL